MTAALETLAVTPLTRPRVSVVPTLDAIASDPILANDLPRAALLALHARVVRALAALEGPLLAAAVEQPPAIAPQTLLDAASAAERLSVPVTWVREMARQGKLLSVQVGRYVRFRPADLDAFVAQRSSA